jgi:hypothetical protein
MIEDDTTQAKQASADTASTSTADAPIADPLPDLTAADQPDVGNAPSTTGAPASEPEKADAPQPDIVLSEPIGTEDTAEAAYETARLAAIDGGDTSWPTWGFLPLDEKLKYDGAA